MKQILIEKYIKPSEKRNIKYRLYGDVTVEDWIDRNYDLHSFMAQPARIIYRKNKVLEKSWFKKGKYKKTIMIN